MVEAGGDLGHPTEHLVHHAFDVAELSFDDGQEQRVEELVNGPPALPGEKGKLNSVRLMRLWGKVNRPQALFVLRGQTRGRTASCEKEEPEGEQGAHAKKHHVPDAADVRPPPAPHAPEIY